MVRVCVVVKVLLLGLVVVATCVGVPVRATSSRWCSAPRTLPEHIDVRAAHPLSVFWYGQPVVESTLKAELCCEPSRATKGASMNVSNVGTVNVDGVGCSLRIGVPWNLLSGVRGDARFNAPKVMHHVAACSDGIDNDGDGLQDQVDPGCEDMSDDSEQNVGPINTDFEFDFEADSSGVYIKSLIWKKIPIITDPGQGKGNRFYLHSDSGTVGKWTSDIQTFEVPLPGDPYQQPVFPWQPNTTTWKNQTSPTQTFSNADINSTIVSQNDTVVIVNTSTPAAIFVDTFRFAKDTITITTSVTSQIPPTKCAGSAAVIYFGIHLGNLQLGNTHNCKCPVVLVSGTGSADGHGQANNCSAACETGMFHLDRLRRGAIQMGQPFDTMKWPSNPVTDPTQLKGWRSIAPRGNAYPESSFSPVTALGDTESFTIGMQVLNPELNSDNTSTYKIEYYDVPAAPTKPLISQYVSAKLAPGETHTFTSVIKVSSAGKWTDPLPSVAAVSQPYVDFFKTTFGKAPGYCPQGAVGMAFRGSGPRFNQTTKTYAPGSSLYSDVLDIDGYLNTVPPVGMDTVMVWQGQIYSSLLMNHGSYEFNPNSDVLDPNVNEVCDAKWTNITNTLHKAKLKLGWFGRPCSHIMLPDNKTAATVQCPSKKILKGAPRMCNLQDLSDPCTKTSMATIDALIAKGVESFYWDSYLCAGRMTFSQAVVKKYPHAFIMGEQGIDVDSIFTGGLPWMGMQAGVWDPSFEPMNSVLQTLVNPYGTAIVGAFGADQNYNHTLYSLQSSKCKSMMTLIQNDLQNIFPKLPPAPVPRPDEIQKRTAFCQQLKLSEQNALWRWNQYGKARGCPQPPSMEQGICGKLPPIGFVCKNGTAKAPPKCVLGWPSTKSNASCMASCHNTLAK